MNKHCKCGAIKAHLGKTKCYSHCGAFIDRDANCTIFGCVYPADSSDKALCKHHQDKWKNVDRCDTDKLYKRYE